MESPKKKKLHVRTPYCKVKIDENLENNLSSIDQLSPRSDDFDSYEELKNDLDGSEKTRSPLTKYFDSEDHLKDSLEDHLNYKICVPINENKQLQYFIPIREDKSVNVDVEAF